MAAFFFRPSGNIIIQSAIWIIGVIAGFLLPFPYSGAYEDTVSWRLIQLVFTLLIGLVILLSISYRERLHLFGWITGTIICSLLAAASLLYFINNRQKCICDYEGERVLIGTQYLNPEYDAGKSCLESLSLAGSEAKDVWTSESIERCRFVLNINHIGTLPLFLVLALTLTQTLWVGLIESIVANVLQPETGGPVVQTEQSGRDESVPKWILPVGFIVGVIALAVVLILIIQIPNPTSPQWIVFRILIALGGAAFSMAISGFLTVQLNLPGKGYIIAGGAVAVFVILFFFTPPLTPSNPNGSQPNPNGSQPIRISSIRLEDSYHVWASQHLNQS